MRITVLIAYASYFVWLLPVYKQHGTKYFYFALFNAIAGPTMFFLGFVLKMHPNYFYPGFLLFQLGSVIFNKRKYVVFVLASLALLIFPLTKPESGLIFGITLVVDFTIFLLILYSLFDLFVKKQVLNLFLTLLFVYMSIDIVKIFDMAINLGEGYIYYFIGEAAQFLFAVSFMFINYDTKNIKLKFKSLEEIETQ